MRRPWLAFLLSVLFPGLGQLYAGEPIRGAVALLWAVVLFPPAAIALLAPMSTSSAALSGAFAIVVVLYLLVAADAWGRARVRRERAVRSGPRPWTYVLFILAGIGVGLAAASWIPPTLWYRHFLIPTRSMEPTLMPGDRVVAEMHGIDLRRLRRGDVILYRSRAGAATAPGGREVVVVKRLIGLPGDSVEIRDGRLELDGQILTGGDGGVRRDECREGRSWHVLIDPRTRDFGPVRVPGGHVFVLGDNRFASRDSREHGAIAEADVLGRLVRVWWPWDRIGEEPFVDAGDGCPGE